MCKATQSQIVGAFWRAASDARRAASGSDEEAIAYPLDDLSMIAVRNTGAVAQQAFAVLEEIEASPAASAVARYAARRAIEDVRCYPHG